MRPIAKLIVTGMMLIASSASAASIAGSSFVGATPADDAQLGRASSTYTYNFDSTSAHNATGSLPSQQIGGFSTYSAIVYVHGNGPAINCILYKANLSTGSTTSASGSVTINGYASIPLSISGNPLGYTYSAVCNLPALSSFNYAQIIGVSTSG